MKIEPINIRLPDVDARIIIGKQAIIIEQLAQVASEQAKEIDSLKRQLAEKSVKDV